MTFVGASLGEDLSSLMTSDGVRARPDDRPAVAIIMELCSEGALSDALRGGAISNRRLVSLARDLADGLRHLHKVSQTN